MTELSGSRDFEPVKKYFVGVDSDGCVFDTMEMKQRQCFAPCFVEHFDLYQIDSLARETWEYVNLHASTRGCSRFAALLDTVSLIERRIDRTHGHDLLPDLDPLRTWMEQEKRVSVSALKAYLEIHSDALLQQVYDWSHAVDVCIRKQVRNVPPFPLAAETLELVARHADVVVVSQTPHEALVREWNDQKLAGFVRSIAGQEGGSKLDQLKEAAGSRYPNGHMLMIGDAPGDLEAARGIGACFFPIMPGNEAQSWELLYQEALSRFFSGCYAGIYEQELVDAFVKLLSDNPPWEV